MEDLFYFQILTLVIIIFLYHITEYLLAKYFHPEDTTASSFLITKEYLIAFSVGFTEFIIGHHFWKSKSDPGSIIIWTGFVMIIIGLYCRFSAIITGGKSFNHVVQHSKRPEHQLVTHGIYKYIRHPGYFGFFVFALGTQLFLKNIVSTIGFIAVLWYFFNDRIQDEEYALIKFFGHSYVEYKNKTPTLIPFIK